MPLILATAHKMKSGITCADLTGVSYEYPRRYSSLVTPGTWFAYYAPGPRRRDYFGAGVIGAVRPSAANPALLECRIECFRTFPSPVPLKDKDHSCFEDASRGPIPGDLLGAFRPHPEPIRSQLALSA